MRLFLIQTEVMLEFWDVLGIVGLLRSDVFFFPVGESPFGEDVVCVPVPQANPICQYTLYIYITCLYYIHIHTFKKIVIPRKTCQPLLHMLQLLHLGRE